MFPRSLALGPSYARYDIVNVERISSPTFWIFPSSYRDQGARGTSTRCRIPRSSVIANARLVSLRRFLFRGEKRGFGLRGKFLGSKAAEGKEDSRTIVDVKMHSTNAYPSCTLLVVGILASSTTLINVADSTPLAYGTYGRRELAAERPQLFFLVDQRLPELENEMFETGNDPRSTVIRTKRPTTLSIVDPIDILRRKVLSAIAQRKALQDQRQIDANRRFLDIIGKRSAPGSESELSRVVIEARSRNEPEYALGGQRGESREGSTASERIPTRTQDWFDADDLGFRDGQDDRTRREVANELRLL
ncbi:hypothetical protein KM043_007443 [Ampulex compressa]|nr:hypothetical protein KM043_007443 [Ampulex compressa]